MLFHLLLFLVAQEPSTSPQQPRISQATEQPAATAITGKVLTEKGTPLPGVTVNIQGTSQATSTNASGEFLLMVSDPKATLVFKYQGYRDQALVAGSGNQLLVTMRSVIGGGEGGGSSAPEIDTIPADVVKYAEEEPQFPGGDAAYADFIRKKAVFPAEAKAKKASGKVFVRFIVDEQGHITNPTVIRGCGNGLDEEALRLVRIMPWWIPGKVAGKPVRVLHVLMVPFVIKDES